jgi:hypothetical protein
MILAETNGRLQLTEAKYREPNFWPLGQGAFELPIHLWIAPLKIAIRKYENKNMLGGLIL